MRVIEKQLPSLHWKLMELAIRESPFLGDFTNSVRVAVRRYVYFSVGKGSSRGVTLVAGGGAVLVKASMNDQ